MKSLARRLSGLFLAAALFCAITQVTPVGNGWIHFGLTSLLLAAACAAYLFSGRLRRFLGRLAGAPVHLCFLAWPAVVLGAMLAAGGGAGLGLFFKEWVQLIMVFVMGPLLFRCATDEGWSWRFIRCLWAAFFVATLAAFRQYFSLQGDVLDNAVRVGGFLPNRTLYGAFIAMALPLLTADLIDRRRSRWKYAAALYLGLSLVSVLHAGMLLAAVAGTGTVIAARGCIRRAAAWGAGVLLVFKITAVIYWSIALGALNTDVIVHASPGQALTGLPHTLILEDSVRMVSAEGRLRERCRENDAALGVLADNPYAGVGFGNYQNAVSGFKQFQGEPFLETVAEKDRHALWLVLGCETGLPGILLLMGLVFLAFRKTGVESGIRGALIAFIITAVFTVPSVRGLEALTAFIFSSAFTAGNPRQTLPNR